jgi:hypothetical protein
MVAQVDKPEALDMEGVEEDKVAQALVMMGMQAMDQRQDRVVVEALMED